MATSERYVVDTGHLVAWEGSLQYTPQSGVRVFRSFVSGEGIVAEFTGPGEIYSNEKPGGARRFAATVLSSQAVAAEISAAFSAVNKHE
ncbi:MAG: AIM24 family protein [Pyrinomonadaceae bacterium]